MRVTSVNSIVLDRNRRKREYLLPWVTTDTARSIIPPMFRTESILQYIKTHLPSSLCTTLAAVFVCALMGGCHQAGLLATSGEVPSIIGQARVVPPQLATIPNSALPPATATARVTRPVALLGIEPFGEPESTETLPRLLSASWSPAPSSNLPAPPARLPAPFESGCSDIGIGQDVCSGCKPFTFKDDYENFMPMLREDARGVANWDNALVLGVGLAGTMGIRHDLDNRVRLNVARHPLRWGDGSKALGRLAEPQYQVPVILAVYAHSLRTQDEELHEFSKSLVSAFTISGLSTLAVKGIANTDRPSPKWNGGHFGFPSYHSSSSFTIAAVVDEYYGPAASMPAYALAGLIGWSRIDEQDHDVSDVAFGAVLGYVIGKSVAKKHRTGDSRLRMLPYVHPTDGTTGLLFDWPF
jgi:hypothetical protein